MLLAVDGDDVIVGPGTYGDIVPDGLLGNDPGEEGCKSALCTFCDCVVQVATGNFWGAASGPGADPADPVCLSGSASADLQPFASKPFEVKAVVKP